MVAADSDRIPRVPPYSGASLGTTPLPVRAYHPLRTDFPDGSSSWHVLFDWSYNPGYARDATGLGSSHFDRHYFGNRYFFLFLRVLRCFSSPRSLQQMLVTGLQPAGFPHSDISGSVPVCRSPELFAAYHVLPRFRKPRHPPFALLLFLVLISESFATFTSQIFYSFCLMKLQSLFRNSKKLEFVTLIQTIISF